MLTGLHFSVADVPVWCMDQIGRMSLHHHHQQMARKATETGTSKWFQTWKS